MSSRTPTFRVETQATESTFNSPMEWRSKVAGKPTDTNIEKFLGVLNSSMEPGQCNAHLRDAFPGFAYTGARVIRQSTGEVVASHNWE